MNTPPPLVVVVVVVVVVVARAAVTAPLRPGRFSRPSWFCIGERRLALWEQEAASSNLAIPTKSAGQGLVMDLPGGLQDRLTVI